MLAESLASSAESFTLTSCRCLHRSFGSGLFAFDSGEWHEAELQGDTVRYSAGRLWKEVPAGEHRHTPNEETWTSFDKALNHIGVWTWKPDYSDPCVLDGGSWEIEIEWDGRKLRSGGENGYPGCDDPDYSKSRAFSGLVDAVKRLLNHEDAFEPLPWG